MGSLALTCGVDWSDATSIVADGDTAAECGDAAALLSCLTWLVLPALPLPLSPPSPSPRLTLSPPVDPLLLTVVPLRVRDLVFTPRANSSLWRWTSLDSDCRTVFGEINDWRRGDPSLPSDTPSHLAASLIADDDECVRASSLSKLSWFKSWSLLAERSSPSPPNARNEGLPSADPALYLKVRGAHSSKHTHSPSALGFGERSIC
jgi:hypothetical protein